MGQLQYSIETLVSVVLTCCFFLNHLQMNFSDGEWSTDGYHVLSIGKPQHSVRCLTIVADRIWCGYRNLVYVIDPSNLNIVVSCMEVLEFDIAAKWVFCLRTHSRPIQEKRVKYVNWCGLAMVYGVRFVWIQLCDYIMHIHALICKM